MKKKISLILICIISLFIITGCDEDNENVIISNNKKVDVSEMEHKHCTRAANAGSDIDVNLDYDIYYRDDQLLLLKSVEKVTSLNSSDLDRYESAYKGIKSNYDGLEYYDQTVTRDDSSVVNTTIINYEKINIKALLDIEGEEDNIIVDGKASVNSWMALGKKFGIVCGKTSDQLIEDNEALEDLVEEDSNTGEEGV